VACSSTASANRVSSEALSLSGATAIANSRKKHSEYFVAFSICRLSKKAKKVKNQHFKKSSDLIAALH